MLKIGFDRRDYECRKFYFDDSAILTSNPPRYKVWYVDDETEVDYIECEYVFVLKSVKNKDNEPSAKSPSKKSTPTPNTVKEEKSVNIVESVTENAVENVVVETPKEESSKIDNITHIDPEIVKGVQAIIKPKRTRTSTKTIKITPKPKTESTTIQIADVKYEYKVVDDYFNDSDNLEKILNDYGKDGWELCGFEIYKNGLTKPNSILYILKKQMR